MSFLYYGMSVNTTAAINPPFSPQADIIVEKSLFKQLSRLLNFCSSSNVVAC